MRKWHILLFVTVSIALYSCHVGRFFIYNFADHTDYKKFPSREISKGDSTFHFKRALQEKTININGGYDSFESYMKANKTLSFLVIRNDTVLYDWYHDKMDSASMFTTFSMAKSFVGLLIGIAIEEGKINSVNDPITKYIPEFKNPGFEKVTIQHLLNMESGIEFKESYFNPFGHIAKYYYGRKILNYVPKLKIEEEPGKGFNYKSLDTQLLGLIIERATQTKLATYLELKIWRKLGMEFPATWSTDSKKGDTEKAFCCLNARVHDFAKIGRLMLNEGVYNGEQIVPKNWIRSSMKRDNGYQGYANQWWILRTDEHELMAQGILGQYLYINPAKNIIIVRMGKNWGKEVNWWTIFSEVTRNLK